ncbi:putative ribonuclease H-like domain-containing protein, partial [Tanacetum coccineum]
ANTHSRTAYTEKLSALTAGNNQLKAQVNGKTSSGPSTSETPKVLAPGMYNLGSKYIPPPKRANWVKPTPLPKKRQVTFSEPPRPSLKPTQKPVVHPNKQTNVCVPMSTGVKPTSGASKPVPKRALQNHSSLPAKSANARRVEAHHRTLNKKNRVDSNLLVKHSVSVSNLNNVCGACNKSLVFANHNDCLVMCDDSVNVKPHQTKRLKRQPKKEWKPIKNVGKPIKRVWKPISKLVVNSRSLSEIRRIGYSEIGNDEYAAIVGLMVIIHTGKFSITTYGTSAANEKEVSTKEVCFGIVDDYHQIWMDNGTEFCELRPRRMFGVCGPKADIGIFVGYAPTKKAYRIYNKRTRKIQETVHVAFDELTEGLTSVQTSSGLAPQQMTSVTNSTELELTALQSGRSRSALAKPTEMHLTAIKRIFRYLKGTINMGLWYPKDSGFELKAFAGCGLAGMACTHGERTSGTAQCFGHAIVSWSSRIVQRRLRPSHVQRGEVHPPDQDVVLTLWMRSQLRDYGFACLNLRRARSKQSLEIYVYHFNQEIGERESGSSVFRGRQNSILADIFTKIEIVCTTRCIRNEIAHAVVFGAVDSPTILTVK